MNVDRHTTLTYTLDGNDHIASIEGDWDGFAIANQASRLTRDRVLGRPIWEFIDGPETAEIHRLLFDTVRERGSLGVTLPFRCDSPKVRRHMQMTVTRFGERGIEISSRIIREQKRPHVALFDVSVPRSDELLRVCSWCKKVDVPTRRWVEVEYAIRELHLLERPLVPAITHGMCEACLNTFLDRLERDRSRLC